MAGITDSPFRRFMKDMGCGIVVTELISATGLAYASEKTRRLMNFAQSERPLGIQLFGEDPATLAEGARLAEGEGADFIDLNFGCPVAKVVKKGGGSAVLRDLRKLESILRAVRAALRVPLTIKIRTGWDAPSRNAVEAAQIAGDEGVLWVAIHGRTRTQGYEGLADWEYIAEVKSRSPVPIIGNGDIHSAAQAVERLRSSRCDGVMIGRGSLKNPWIFREAQALWLETRLETRAIKQESLPNPDFAGNDDNKNFFGVFARLKYYLEQSCDERVVLIQLRKFAAWFSAGYPGSAHFRKKLFLCNSAGELMALAEEFFASLDRVSQSDTSHEAFLMGGHG